MGLRDGQQYLDHEKRREQEGIRALAHDLGVAILILVAIWVLAMLLGLVLSLTV